MSILLEPFTHADITRFISWIQNEEELIQFAGPYFSFPVTVQQVEQYLAEERRKVFTVRDKVSGVVFGHCEINATDAVPRLARIFIGDKQFRGKGHGKEMVIALLRKAFALYNTECIELNVYTWNTSAIRCYESVGFVINPGKESDTTVQGKVWHSQNMVIHREQFYRSYAEK